MTTLPTLCIWKKTLKVDLDETFQNYFSVEFYLLRNGTDSPTCGSNVTDPCETFPRLLKVFETKYHPPDSPALAVVTDTDVTINKTLLVRITVCLTCHTGISKVVLSSVPPKVNVRSTLPKTHWLHYKHLFVTLQCKQQNN